MISAATSQFKRNENNPGTSIRLAEFNQPTQNKEKNRNLLMNETPRPLPSLPPTIKSNRIQDEKKHTSHKDEQKHEESEPILLQ